MSITNIIEELKNNPIKLGKVLWPHISFYKQQRMILYSLWENDETIVPAGHMLGKDFVTGFACLAFFLTRNPCRVVTTSVDSKQLEGVLWGEIRRFIQECKYKLIDNEGGPLIVNHLHIRKIFNGKTDSLSYLIGRVSAKGEGLSGHHIAKTGDGIPRTLGVFDEASGCEQEAFSKVPEWADRILIIGNPYNCNNYFRWSVEGKPGGKDMGGDVPREGSQDGYHRKVIHIAGEDSPNVRLAFEQQKRKLEPTNKIILPGVLPWEDYCKRLRQWDQVKITVGIKARFYQGAENLLYPAEWLNLSEERAKELEPIRDERIVKAIGVDSGEGSANTSWTGIDEMGILTQISKKTPNTAVIPNETIALGRLLNVPSEYWIFDRGGGGLQHANTLRERGYNPRTVGFGEGMNPEPKRGVDKLEERKQRREEKYAYINRRGEMYGMLRNLLDPSLNEYVFAIPHHLSLLRQQLALIPLMYDGEGRLILPPKNRRHKGDKRPTLTELIGHSPDEADSLVLAIYGMLNKANKVKAGAAW